MNLYDLELGDTFRIGDEIFKLASIDAEGGAQAPRVATVVRGLIEPCGPLINNNFNAYARVERVDLVAVAAGSEIPIAG